MLPFPETDPPQPRNYLRPVAALALLAVLLVGSTYTVWGPWVNEQFRLSNSFEGVLTGVSTTDDDCRQAQPVTAGGSLDSTRTLCVCGYIHTDEQSVDYRLRLKKADQELIEQKRWKDQKPGPFCHRWRLELVLGGGRYVIEMRDANTVATIWFSVRQLSVSGSSWPPVWP